MRLLLDTHLLVWSYAYPAKLSDAARSQIADPDNDLFFSTASLWELAIKHSLGRRGGITIDAEVLHRELLEHDYTELPINSAHALAVQDLPPIHKDPFDRLLVAQANVEGFILLTADAALGRYAGPVLKV